MQRMSSRSMRGGALLALLALLILVPVSAAADSALVQIDPDEGRLGPPIGVAAESEEPSAFDAFIAWLMGRLGPPIG
jgi:hypothetical protein